MNYRHKLLQHTLKQHEAKWDLERQNLQQDIVNLENSTDIKVVQSLEKKNKELQKLLTKQKKEHQEQLRTINTLFDPNAKNYETIEFSGLYSLLEDVASKTKNKSWWGK